MVQNAKNTVSEKEYKVLFKEMFFYLKKDCGVKMTVISDKASIDYDKLINISRKKGSSSGTKSMCESIYIQFAELHKKYASHFGYLLNKATIAPKDNRVDKLEKEVERLKRQNEEIILSLLKMQNKLFYPESD